MTERVEGMENYVEMFKKLTAPGGAIKVFCEVAGRALEKDCFGLATTHDSFTTAEPSCMVRRLAASEK